MARQITRRRVVATAGAGAVAMTLGARLAISGNAAPKLEKKDSYKVGFSQVEENNPWRIAQTESMRAEAEAGGHELIYTNAAGSATKQIADVDSMIAQQVDAIFLAPREEVPLAQACLKAEAAGIPVILLDRNVDETIAKPGEAFLTFIGSDFYQEGARAAEWLAKEMGGEAQIIELEGTTGSTPAIDRQRGFRDYLAAKYTPDERNVTAASTPAAAPEGGYPGMEIVASQTGDFARDLGRTVFETLYQANTGANAVYAHNDEMAIGAILAMEAQGLVPGEDLIIVSIDGSAEALQNIIDGKLGATVECNPRFGPIAFETLLKYAAGEEIPTEILNQDKFYDASNAEEFIDEAY